MKICDGKIIELDPTKYYLMVLNPCVDIDLANIKMTKPEEGIPIIFAENMDDIEFVENTDRIKGIMIKEF